MEYCDYLQKKYGIGRCNYMTENWERIRTVSRTRDGLYVHHKYEDRAKWLSNVEYAKKSPYEWQLKENLVYCDLLEHLFLHLLICEYPSPNKNIHETVGISGILDFIVPELNDVYCGWVTDKPWQQRCHNKIIDDKIVYMQILKRIKFFIDDNCPEYFIAGLYKSMNVQKGLWSEEKNESLYQEIKNL